MKKVLKDNRGLSLLEIVVVLSMMVVVAGVASLSLAIIPSSEAKKSVTSVDSMMTRTRTGTLTRAGNVVMAVSVALDGAVSVSYYEQSDPDKAASLFLKEQEILSDGDNVLVYYYTDKEMSVGKPLSAGSSIGFSFSRNTMGFQKISEAKGIFTSTLTGAGTTLGTVKDDNEYCYFIEFIGGGTSYHIELSPLTGSHYSSLY